MWNGIANWKLNWERNATRMLSLGCVCVCVCVCWSFEWGHTSVRTAYTLCKSFPPSNVVTERTVNVITLTRMQWTPQGWLFTLITDYWSGFPTRYLYICCGKFTTMFVSLDLTSNVFSCLSLCYPFKFVSCGKHFWQTWILSGYLQRDSQSTSMAMYWKVVLCQSCLGPGLW